VPLARSVTFRAQREQVFALFTQGRYESALAEAGTLRRRFPSRGEIPFWMACALCRLGRADEALAVLREGNDGGLWWPAEWLLDDEDLAPLRAGDGLREVVAASQRLRTAHLTDDHARDPIVLLPAPTPGTVTPPTGSSPGLLVALHGWGEQMTDFVEPWRAAARAGLVVAVPESSQELTPAFFVWDDRERARDDVARALSPLRRRWRVDERRSLYAGFSQGGGLAVLWALAGGPLRTGAFLAIGTGLSDVAPDALCTHDQAAAREAHGRLIVGDADEAFDDARALHDALRDAGVASDLQVVPGLGHDLPDDLDARLKEALGLLIPGS
jgi:predicted esterase